MKTLTYEHDGYIFTPATAVSMACYNSTMYAMLVMPCVALCCRTVHELSKVEACQAQLCGLQAGHCESTKKVNVSV